MVKFLFNLIRAFRIATQELRYVEVLDLPGSWTEEDRRWLAGVFRTPHGQKFKQRLTNMVFKSAISATQAPTSEAVKAQGIAKGVAFAVAAIQSHYISPRAQRGISAPSDESQSE